ncbi:hypothetical protein C8R43DRAFT_357801 [Mycena crocata]|nr:hypothetical protein C8R43DRAFT_357801 [Mycena crocata]
MLLPIELSDKIIELLASEPDALASSSLVCRQWVPASRFHAFSTVKVSGAKLNGFLSLLQHKNNTFRWHIKHLVLPTLTWSTFEDCIHGLPEMPSVHTLSLSHVSGCPVDVSPREVIATFPQLTEVHVTELSRACNMIRILAELPHLQRVRIFGKRDADLDAAADEAPPAPTNAFPCLQDLWWSSSPQCGALPEVCRWLAQTPPPRLETLNLPLISFPRDEHPVSELLYALAPSLRNLSFRLVSRNFPTTHTNPADTIDRTLLNFSAYTHLRALSFGTTNIDIGSPLLSRLPAILSSISSTELKSLHIHLPPMAVDELSRAFEEVDSILCCARFSKVEILLLVFWNCWGRERRTLKESSSGWLPFFRCQGKIQISFHHSPSTVSCVRM